MRDFEDELVRVIESYLEARASQEGGAPARRGGTPGELLPKAQAVAKELIVQAIAAGLPLTRFTLHGEPLGGGNTAGLVALATLHAPFVFKLDDTSQKLAEEGVLIRRLRNEVGLPKSLRESFPRIYAVRTEAPYAYLMEAFPKEEGFISLEDRLYPAEGEVPRLPEVSRFLHAALDLLFHGYRETIDRRRQPNVSADYIDRIRERLAKTAEADERYAARVVRLRGGEELTPWDETLRAIDAEAAKIQAITPRFMTYVHGDPNPGNLILRETNGSFDVKQIDPKEWGTGDYLFDVAKLTHFIECTAPAEKTTYGAARLIRFATDRDRTLLEYDLPRAPWTESAVEIIRSRARGLALEHGDEHWELRYKLGMASNLLGLPIGRLKRKPEAAAILYGEGLRWLEEFRTGLEGL